MADPIAEFVVTPHAVPEMERRGGHRLEGNLLSLEILGASRHVTEARKIEYQTTA